MRERLETLRTDLLEAVSKTPDEDQDASDMEESTIIYQALDFMPFQSKDMFYCFLYER